MPQISRMPMSFQVLHILAPSYDIARMALLKQVSGRTLQIFCIQTGNTAVEKKVPDNKNCGKANILAYTGITLSLRAILLTINPAPIKTIQAKKLISIISMKVIMPFTKLNLKNR